MDKPLDIRVGQQWERRDGAIVTVTGRLENGNFVCSSRVGLFYIYTPSGQTEDDRGDQLDLIGSVEEVPPSKPEPDPAKSEPPDSIRSGSEPFYVVVVDDDSGGRATNDNPGHSITWETQIPEGSNLRAVLRQRAAVGNRYGTTYIAECRIIPELTHDPL
jgi:hypothetical protein